ncbi:MAG: TlpA family protein disulfide reductase [Proteobacteria bacterium]|nr:TlpA family protein disulfide reductase [Pseudomonadota bacterium]MBS0574509.1 TlpA family protein disulfide reductase [Pseudomonadota bacterium]
MTSLTDLAISEWLNATPGFSAESLRGRVVAAEAFQMLCPGCVSHGLPQAKAIRQIFPESDVAVIGLHTVFEHHAAMTPVALRAFLHEYRISFPVGVDQPGAGALPVTMGRFGLEGTPSLLLFDRAGSLRARHFGQVHDMVIGAEIAVLLGEAAPAAG